MVSPSSDGRWIYARCIALIITSHLSIGVYIPPSISCDKSGKCCALNVTDYEGPNACHIVNIGLNRKAEQTSTYCTAGRCYNASLATDAAMATCSRTNTSPLGRPQLWSVNLQKRYPINRVKIFSGPDCCEESLAGVTVDIFSMPRQSELCYADTTKPGGKPGQVINAPCKQPIMGMRVHLSVTNATKFGMCEVQILMCESGWYGQFCQYRCDKGGYCRNCDKLGIKCKACQQGYYGEYCVNPCGKCRRRFCNKDTGACNQYKGKRCQPGWQGERCDQPCSHGHYGSDCNLTCGQCRSNKTCDDVLGMCVSDGTGPLCAAGWWKKRCHMECTEGLYGEDCRYKCGHCIKGAACNKGTGMCPKGLKSGVCAPGWHGEICDIACPQGRYGADCKSTCGHCWDSFTNSCNEMTGICPKPSPNKPRCLHGWKEYTCDTECAPGEQGPDCLFKCGDCYENAVCDRETGLCPHIQSQTPRCAAGSSGDKCVIECLPGHYGADCVHTCGKCWNPHAFCDQESGECPPPTHGTPRCAAGWTGFLCNTACVDNYYGEDCAQLCGLCAKNETCDPFTGFCKHIDGHAVCMPGWKDKFCKTACDAGHYGPDCNSTCGYCLDDSLCDREHGHCPIALDSTARCMDGWLGHKCDITLKTEPVGLTTAGIVGIVIGAFAVIVILFVSSIAIVLCRRKHHPRLLSTGQDRQVELSTLLKGQERNGIRPPLAKKANNQRVPNDPAGDTDDEAEDEEYNLAAFHPASEPIRVEDLLSYILKKQGEKSFNDEFEKLPSGLTAPCVAATKPENKSKNRFQNIYAYDHSRVILKTIKGDPNSDYINACYIQGYGGSTTKYIASQGPIVAVVNDFWRMVWQLGSNKILMLTMMIEDLRRKCDQYWPDSGSGQYGSVNVKLLDEEQFADFIIRSFQLTSSGSPRIVKQFHFTAWPDHGVPQYPTALVQFRDKVLSTEPVESAGPPVIHCSAGIGRSGTFIALDYLIDQARSEGKVNVFDCVRTLRKQRANIIQTAAQYEFLHEGLLEALQLSPLTIPSHEFEDAFQHLTTAVNSETGDTELAEQFELLNKISPTIEMKECTGSRLAENVNRNRDSRILASDMWRPYLSTLVDGTSDYINAVYMHGYKEKRIFILTQMPMPNTVIDLYRLMLDRSSHTIVTLDMPDTNDSSVGYYWPAQNSPMSVGPFKVESLEQFDGDQYLVQTLRLTYTSNRMPEKHVLAKRFQCKFWPAGSSVPSSPGALITLIEEVDRWRHQSGDGPVTVQCMNGSDKSGLYCVVCNALEKVKIDHELNMPQTVKQLRIHRPQIIKDLEQYTFVHESVITFLENFQTYSNFKG